jgi:hydrogenase expression/formation protein HypE
MPDEKITLAHGNGGIKTGELVKKLFLRYFDDPALNHLGDSAILPGINDRIAMSTDSFVVHPHSFRGGNIGKLAVCGTVNDLAVAGAEPLYLTVGYILEEGLEIDELEEYVKSMAETAREAAVRIVTGDTKVVGKGECDKLYINTSGVGMLASQFENIANGSLIRPGDQIIINGNIGDHGMAIYTERFPDSIKSPIKSDCACLNGLIKMILDSGEKVHFMRDPTRGGLAGVLHEVCTMTGSGINLNEADIPVSNEVSGMCELLGFDPLHLANEGKFVLITDKNSAPKILEICQSHNLGADAAIIGEVTSDNSGNIILQTKYGGRRLVDPLIGDQLPRIC